MLTLHKHLDKDIKIILNGLTVVIDTRENEVNHITEYYDNKNIPYVFKKLDVGDYSCKLPAHGSLFNMPEPIDFCQKITIERKNGLEELSGCIAQSRDRFEREFERGIISGTKMILMIEDGSYLKILQHNYRTNLNEKSFIATLFSFQARYNLEVQFIPYKMSGWFIYNTLKYYAREFLKQEAG